MVKKFVIVLGVAAAFMAANVFAAGAEAPVKPKKPETAPHMAATVRVEGTVSVTKDANDVVTSIEITTATKAVYHVTLDKKGKELGSLNGKEVEARCVITEKDKQKWVTVHEFRPIEKKKETPKETPAAKPRPTPPKPNK
ncbi:MAG: hypothetical protein WAK60_03105 [Sedimentisphaerales bacterium]